MELREFKINVLPLRGRLLDYARRLADDPDDAEDVVQEVLLRLWDRRGELGQCRNIEAFAMTMVHNRCVDLWRTQQTNRVALDQMQATTDAGYSPEELVEMRDEVELMRRIIDSLPPLQRLVMQLKDVEERETEEIAEITGCNVESIRSNLSRARKRVRDIYLNIVQERRRRNQP